MRSVNRTASHAIRRHVWGAVVLVAVAMPSPAGQAAGRVAASLDRPAVTARFPERAVLLAAANAGARVVAVGERGLVLYSDDGGKQWQMAQTPVSVTLTALRFVDDANGIAVGHGATVLGTADGGKTWVRRLDGREAARIELAAAKASGDPVALKSAERLRADGPDKPLLDVLLLGDRRVLVVGAYGLALFSEDGGKTWQSWRNRLPNPKELHLYAARRDGDRIVIAGEQGLLLQSRDAGQHFSRLATPYNGSFFALELPDSQSIIVAGLRGNVLRSGDAGLSWTPIASPMPVSITATAVAPDGGVLAANQAGFVMALQGDRLMPLNRKPLPPLNGLLPRAGAPLLALSVQGALVVDFEPSPAK